MAESEIVVGEGRTRVILRTAQFGADLVVIIGNENEHIGAVAIGEWDDVHQRASVSVHTRLGHKDDVLAQRAAHAISKSTRSVVCVIAGVHLDSITSAEIEQVVKNTEAAVEKFLESPRNQ